jgi:hypothetical protein
MGHDVASVPWDLHGSVLPTLTAVTCAPEMFMESELFCCSH